MPNCLPKLKFCRKAKKLYKLLVGSSTKAIAKIATINNSTRIIKC